MMLSYWEQDLFKPKYDYLIIGSGFSGLWMAYLLKMKKPNAHIGILEKGTLPSGASTKNAGFACFGSPSELLENVKTIGWDKTLELTEKRYQGIQLIKAHFGTEIDYNPCGATELFSEEGFFKENLEQLDLLNQNLRDIVNAESHFKEDKNIILNSNFRGFENAISNAAEASIHSGKLFYALYKKLVSLDVKFFFGTEVEHIETESAIAEVKTKNLGDFQAQHVCICTNAFTNTFLPSQNIKPGRGQVLITQPIENLPFNSTFHFEKGYFYFKNVGKRVLFGGGRNLDIAGETTTAEGTTELIQNQLIKYLKENILPDTNFEIATIWSGVMAFNESHTPISEILKPNLSANVCMNGMGVALAPFLAEELVGRMG
ncbi:FAD-binding oxidoreductase [Lacihabitans sp. LS3-19]|uniref:NAD(P)/FAD-dependent oxidoreductase n=1 Tax=Lacihabitans sp. LS3-19 TaxID=2487335 RepID=UPI0020CBB09A|nr:FAD-dependent oxidoreductase [Lacihabitans sp. LS3-19]MCP9769754.1 FAD-binding oxidoreductase [Lacihabitans sp. LS3-19]